jgi:serpin B
MLIAPLRRASFPAIFGTFAAAVLAAEEIPEKTPPPPTSPQVRADCEAVVRGNTQFALDLYARLRAKEGNLFYSPYSISTALAMTYAGADGATADQMSRVLHFPRYQLRLHRAFANLRYEINGRQKKPDFQLHVVNALWGQQGYDFLDDFKDTTRQYYGAGLREVDFKREPEKGRRTINAWVARQTSDRIKDIVPPGLIGPMTRLVLANAVYFKAGWARKFTKRHTSDQPFHLTAKKSVKVPLMTNRAHFDYLDGGTFQALELPYAGWDVSMVIFLPKKVDGLPAFEEALTVHQLSGWLAKLKSTDVIYHVPRFQVRQELLLGEELSAMGMRDAFSPEDCNFSRISTRKDVFLRDVLHQAFVKVEEAQTEAAAATVVIPKEKEDPGEKPKPKPPQVFRADHPFVFLIRDGRTGSILFLGRVVDPRDNAKN